MTYYRVCLRAGGSIVADAATTRLMISQGKVISVKAIGRESPLYQRREVTPAAGTHYLTK